MNMNKFIFLDDVIASYCMIQGIHDKTILINIFLFFNLKYRHGIFLLILSTAHGQRTMYPKIKEAPSLLSKSHAPWPSASQFLASLHGSVTKM